MSGVVASIKDGVEEVAQGARGGSHAAPRSRECWQLRQ